MKIFYKPREKLADGRSLAVLVALNFKERPSSVKFAKKDVDIANDFPSSQVLVLVKSTLSVLDTCFS